MVAEGLIEEDDKPVVMRSLLLRHRHVHDDRFRFSISGKKHSSYTSLQVSRGRGVRAVLHSVYFMLMFRCSDVTRTARASGTRAARAGDARYLALSSGLSIIVFVVTQHSKCYRSQIPTRNIQN